MYDIIIIGAGPAGMSAAMYAVKKQLKTLIVDENSAPTGTEGDAGFRDIADAFEKSLRGSAPLLEFRKKTKVVNVEKNVVSFSVEVSSGEVLYCRAVIIASGCRPDGEPNTEFVLLVQKDHQGAVKVDAFMKTNIAGIFAPGNVNAVYGKDSFVAAGEGARAALSAAGFLGAGSVT